jgi:hypothetical protein
LIGRLKACGGSGNTFGRAGNQLASIRWRFVSVRQ